MDLIIEKYTSEDRTAVLSLLETAFNHPFSLDRWRWLHEQNMLAPSIVLTAKFEGKIIGVFAIIKKEILFQGEKLILGRDIDPAVHPDYRGKGVFSALLKEANKQFENQIDVHLNFANNSSYWGFVKNGWYSRGFKKLIIPAFPLAYHLYRLLYLPFVPIKKANCEFIKTNKTKMFSFSGDGKNEKPISVLKNPAYLEWRYDRKPNAEYLIFKAVSNNKDIALIICSMTGNKITLLDIYNQSEYKKSQLLLTFVLFYLKSHKTHHLISWDSLCEGAAKVLIPAKKGNLIFKINNNSLPADFFQKLENWEIGPGESEFK